MADPATQSSDDQNIKDRIAEYLRENPGGILERVADQFGVSTFDVLEALPESERSIVSGDRFEQILAELSNWDDALLIVHTPNIVLECKGKIPPGSFARGYFNIHGEGPIGGHIRADRCKNIAFVSRSFMGRESASLQFFDLDGAAMFKIFVPRDENRELKARQLEQFSQLRRQLCE